MIDSRRYSAMLWAAFDQTADLSATPIVRLKRFREEYWVGLRGLGIEPAGPPHNLTDLVWRDAEVASRVQTFLQDRRGSVESIGGDPTSEFDETVMIWDTEHTGLKRMGVGIAIAPRTILTAGHGTDEDAVSTGEGAALLPVKIVLRCAGQRIPGGDIGLLYLRNAVSKSALKLATTEEIVAAQEGVIVSYSHHGLHRRIKISTTITVGQNFIVTSTVNKPNGAVDDGDSGCPIYVSGKDGNPVLAGIFTEGHKTSNFSGESRFVRVDRFETEIRARLESPPCEPQT